MITISEAMGAVLEMRICRYFPSDDMQRVQIAEQLTEMVSDTDQLRWLTRTQCKLDWNGPWALRQLFCTRYRPIDSIPNPDQTSGEAEMGYIAEQSSDTERRMMEWKREQKLLGEAPVSAIDVSPAIKPVGLTKQHLRARENHERLASTMGCSSDRNPIRISATPKRTPEETAALIRELENQTMTPEVGVMGKPEREHFQHHYHAIAELMHLKKVWRAPWRIEIDGCVYKFTVTGYAKKGSPRQIEESKLLADVLGEALSQGDVL